MSEDVKKIAEELVIACKRAYIRDIQAGGDGNVSARVPGKDLMIVKASSSPFIDSTPDEFVITGFDGNLIEGEGKSTREALLHDLLCGIYPRMNAVVHTHSSYSIAWAPTGKALKRTTWYTQFKMSAGLSSLGVLATMIKKEHSPIVEDTYRENPDLSGLLLVDHGLVAIGKGAINAEHTAELIEETTQVVILKVTVLKLGL